MKGLFLVLEGMDGAGKSSQIALLADFFRKQGRQVKSIHFPRLNQKPYGDLIAAYLRGDFGDAAGVHPKLAALLFALDRQQGAAEIRDHVDSGNVVVADRYFYSNLAYQRARLAGQAERDELADWLAMLEFGFLNIPRPDLTLFLDVPLSFSLAKLASGRQGDDRDYLKGKADIHEANTFLQERVREEYLALARQRVGEIGTVDCRSPNGGMADKATIHSRVVDALRYYRVI